MSLYLEEHYTIDLSTAGGVSMEYETHTRPLQHPFAVIVIGDTPRESNHTCIDRGNACIRPLHHDATYYRNCFVGGVMSSSIRWVLTPLDSIKCNMQVHPQKYPTFVGGLQMVYQTQGIRGLYRGLTPTILSYSTQTGTKYALYEYLKDHLNQQVKEVYGDEAARRYQSFIYITAAGTAEALADVLMVPWETLKVQMQTSTTSRPLRFLPSVVALLQKPTTLMEALPPLWSRQILGTMANFLTFEHSANAIYQHLLVVDSADDGTAQVGTKSDYSIPTQLAVTFCAGFLSGIVSTIVSHPADSLLSLKARHPDASISHLIQRTGWRSLATQGLGPRMGLTGSIIGFQWFAYDTFKTFMGMGTTGGEP